MTSHRNSDGDLTVSTPERRFARSIEFGALLYGGGGHLAGWRYPGARPDGQLDIEFVASLALSLERAGFDAIFIADVVSIWGEHLDSLSKTARADFFEPLTLLAALSARTGSIGLVATATTSYNEPYNLARKFASLDHLSGGRAGWNVVTSVVPLEAANFGRDVHYEHGERYRRADEFVTIVRGLWDSYGDDAVVRDKEAGLYYRPEGRRALHHEGEHFRVRGPLNIARPPQGHPVVFQAGASDTGREFAARHGEVIFTATTDLDAAVAYRTAFREQVAGNGRDPDSVRIWPVFSAVIGDTAAEAEEKFAHLQSLLHDDVLRRSLQDNIGDLDFSDVDLDGPLPDIPETNRSKSRRAGILQLAREERLSVREIARRFNERGTTRGTAEQIADVIETWYAVGAADGFNVSFPYLPDALTDFTEQVLPILEHRGVFWRHFGGSLRETLGLDRPERTTP